MTKTPKTDWQSSLPGRRCAICHRIGGSGATQALKALGIVSNGIGYAHANCIAKARKQHG